MKYMVAVLQFLGTNCEYDVCYALEKIQEHYNIQYSLVWFKEQELPKNTSLVIIPGGFSYGDYLRSGAIARFAPIMKAVVSFAQKGGKVLGICNGFQILVESGLLPGALMLNHSHKFISTLSSLKVISHNNSFLRSYNEQNDIHLPIAHGQGCYFIDHENLKKMYDNEQILLTYNKNLNGSIDAIAGICNIQKNVFGLMPHPERAIEKELGSTDGLAMLRDIVC